MVTTVLLVRHGMCDPVGRAIAGRAPGVRLNAEGRRQAGALSGALARLPIKAVFSSPLERAIETARPLASALGLPVQCLAGLLEVDFGDWTGRSLAELEAQPRWRAFNERRETTRIPGGETMAEVIARAADAVAGMHRAHPGEMVAAVSHGDVVRGLLTHYLGMPIDAMLRLEVETGSVSTLEVGDAGNRVLSVNWRRGRVV